MKTADTEFPDLVFPEDTPSYIINDIIDAMNGFVGQPCEAVKAQLDAAILRYQDQWIASRADFGEDDRPPF